MTINIKAPQEGDEVHHEGGIWFVTEITGYDSSDGQWDVELDNSDDEADEDEKEASVWMKWNKEKERWEGV